MFSNSDIRDIEPVCYEHEHIEKVMKKIREKFEEYFPRFLETQAGKGLCAADFEHLQKKFGVDGNKIKNTSSKILSDNFKLIIKEAIDDFESDREDYQKIFRADWLEEMNEDADTFKSKTLRCECPIIRKTLNNRKAKELDKYRGAFSSADPDWLWEVVSNLCEFGDEYQKNYDPETYEDVDSYEELGMKLLDTDEYTAYGVIGGGIKTHMLYKVHPGLFSNRSRSALWALWFLSDKIKDDCRMESEFIMIDPAKNFVQQNYFYPYELFSYYAFEIYKMLRDKAAEYDIYIDPDYRYVIVDEFLGYVAMEHEEAISILKSQIRDGGMGYA